MKLNFGKRVLMFFHWLTSLIICFIAFVCFVFPNVSASWYEMAIHFLGNSIRVKIAAGAFLLIYLLFSVIQICMVFGRSSKRFDRGFIAVDNSETGRVRLAVSAIEQMVRQSVSNIEGISNMKIGIENADEAIGISVSASVMSGCHVPTITMNMQQAIRKFVELNCGVKVHSVSITINTVESISDGEKKGRGKKGTPVQAVPSANLYESAPDTTEPVRQVEEPETVTLQKAETAKSAIEFHEPVLTLDKPEITEPSEEEPSENTDL